MAGSRLEVMILDVGHRSEYRRSMKLVAVPEDVLESTRYGQCRAISSSLEYSQHAQC